MSDLEKIDKSSLKLFLKKILEAYDEKDSEIATLRLQQDLKPLEQLGEMIKTSREQQKISRAILAEYSGVSELTIAKIEKGSLKVNLDKLLAITSVLGISIWVG